MMPDENWDEVGLAIEQLFPQLKGKYPGAALLVAAKADALGNRLSSFLRDTEGLAEKISQQLQVAENLRQESISFLSKHGGEPEKISAQRETAKSLLLKIAAVREKLELHGRESGN